MKPMLLLVAGTLNDEAVWADVRALLGDAPSEVRVVLPRQSSLSAMAEAAWATVADVPAHVPLVLAGFSLGGYVALEMLAHPARQVKAVALLATSARADTAEGQVARERTIAAMEKKFEKVVDGMVPWTTHEPSDALVSRIKAMLLRVGAETAIVQNRAIATRQDHRALLPTLQMPVAVMCGAHDRVTPPDLSRELAAGMAGATLEIVDDAGHMLPLERPDAVARVLRSLL